MDTVPWIIGVSFVLMSFVATSQAADVNSPEWQAKFQDVCSYDRRCQNATKGINQPVLDTLKKLNPLIQEAAKEFGVDPRAIAGCILGEHSMNTDAVDIAEDFVGSHGDTKGNLYGVGKLFGKEYTFGFGQLHFSRAKTAETLAAQVEHRSMLSDEEINKKLLTPEGAVSYAAALLKQAQDMYAKAGYDISKDPGVLTTLYNIGKIQERLDRTIQEKRLPKPNYFGFWVQLHYDELDQAIGASQKSAMTLTPQAKQQAIAQAGKSLTAKQVTVYKPTKEILLSNGPVSCFDNGLVAQSTATAKVGERMEIVSPGVDCNLEPWVLVRGDQGETGWIAKKDFDGATRAQQVDASTCKTDRPDDCKKKLLSKNGDYAGNATQNGELTFSLNKKPEKPFAFDADSFEKKILGEKTKVLAEYKKYKPLTRADLEEMQSAADDFKAKVVKDLKIDPWNPIANPYMQLLTYLNKKQSCLAYDPPKAGVASTKPPAPDPQPSSVPAFAPGVSAPTGPEQVAAARTQARYAAEIASSLQVTYIYSQISDHTRQVNNSVFQSTYNGSPAPPTIDVPSTDNPDYACWGDKAGFLARVKAMKPVENPKWDDIWGQAADPAMITFAGKGNLDLRLTEPDANPNPIPSKNPSGNGNISGSAQNPDPIKSLMKTLAQCREAAKGLSASAEYLDKFEKALTNQMTATTRLDTNSHATQMNSRFGGMYSGGSYPGQYGSMAGGGIGGLGGYGSRGINLSNPASLGNIDGYYDGGYGNYMYQYRARSAASTLDSYCRILAAKDPVAATQKEFSLPDSDPCHIQVFDTTAETSRWVELNQDLAKKMWEDPKDKDQLLLTALKQLLPMQPGSSDHGYATIRELAESLAANPCVTSVFVPEPWLATGGKLIFRESSDKGQVQVDYSSMTCSKGSASVSGKGAK